MTCAGLSGRMRRRFLALLADDRPDPEALLGRLRELRALEETPAFSAVLHLLAHLDVSDGDAERLLGDVLAHRCELTRRLGRDPGLRVATADLLHNLERRLASPMIVETSLLEETERCAMTDSLTGLHNRGFFQTTLEREIRRSRRHGLELSLVLLDLDRFKRVNDDYGHLFGDLVLRRAGTLTRRAVRESDIACRYGGEEFAVILPETDRLGACAVAERVRRRIETAFANRPSGGRAVVMTVSGGIAAYPDDAVDALDLIARADDALYRAKALGRNRIALHPAERRAATRYPARPGSKIELSVRDGFPAVPAQAVNLSRTGALLETSQTCHPADAVRVLLRPGSGAGEASWVVPGRVVWVAPAEGGGQQVGVSFDLPLPEERLAACARPSASQRRAAGGGRR